MKFALLLVLLIWTSVSAASEINDEVCVWQLKAFDEALVKREQWSLAGEESNLTNGVFNLFSLLYSL
jgi:hypothetical protein